MTKGKQRVSNDNQLRVIDLCEETPTPTPECSSDVMVVDILGSQPEHGNNERNISLAYHLGTDHEEAECEDSASKEILELVENTSSSIADPDASVSRDTTELEESAIKEVIELEKRGDIRENQNQIRGTVAV